MEEIRWVRVERALLEEFCTSVLAKMGLAHQEALDTSMVLVAADSRGIPSHGVGRLQRYMNGLEKGIMKISPEPVILRETPASLVLDADGAMGMSISRTTMQSVIRKADEIGTAFASIRNSNHFGIAGYYSEMAIPHDMIGISMTNTAALGVPTGGKRAMFGTNPLSVSIPSASGRIFTLDMATTAVTRGKIEVYAREGNPLPEGWAVDTQGMPTVKGAQLLEDMLFQRGGGLLPLGGVSQLFGGHKGYGLSVLVDILCAVTSGGDFGERVMDSEATSARVSHFFGALKIGMFRDPEDFKADMDSMLDELITCDPAQDSDRVYYAGQKEHESEELSNRKGVPLSEKVYNELTLIGETSGISFPSLIHG